MIHVRLQRGFFKVEGSSRNSLMTFVKILKFQVLYSFLNNRLLHRYCCLYAFEVVFYYLLEHRVESVGSWDYTL